MIRLEDIDCKIIGSYLTSDPITIQPDGSGVGSIKTKIGTKVLPYKLKGLGFTQDENGIFWFDADVSA